MKVHVPVPEQNAASRRPTVFAEHIQRIGIVDDDLDPPFMHELVLQLRAAYPSGDVRVWSKQPGTAPAPDSLIEEMAREIQVAVAGVGM